jgi:DNA-binding transcriptional MerR regulator
MATMSQRAGRPLTIGAVCRRLKEEFPDISISKIRYLEDQGLLQPQRTHGGYRLFAEEDVERLRMILRLQRDEFLPLRVIREELLTPGAARRDRRKKAPTGLRSRLGVPLIGFDELCERSRANPDFVRELEDFQLIEAVSEGGTSGYPESDVDIVASCTRLSQYGLEPRVLRKLRTNAENQAGLLEQVVAPYLHSRNPERRQAGLDDLEKLAGLSIELSQLLFWRALRALVARS